MRGIQSSCTTTVFQSSWFGRKWQLDFHRSPFDAVLFNISNILVADLLHPNHEDLRPFLCLISPRTFSGLCISFLLFFQFLYWWYENVHHFQELGSDPQGLSNEEVGWLQDGFTARPQFRKVVTLTARQPPVPSTWNSLILLLAKDNVWLVRKRFSAAVSFGLDGAVCRLSTSLMSRPAIHWTSRSRLDRVWFAIKRSNDTEILNLNVLVIFDNWTYDCSNIHIRQKVSNLPSDSSRTPNNVSI